MPPRDPIAAVLGPGGLLARQSDSYEHRPQQLEMASLVRRVLDERRYALIEAGTGTGKTLAYLLPAVLCGRKVVLSTATKTLQEQIVNKDIPLLKQASGIDFTATVMKGRGNYLCLERLDKVQEDPHFTISNREEARALRTIEEWATRTRTGDRAELELPEKLAVWRELSATSETCTGQRCPRFEQCFVTRMRRQAADSDLLIVNHHLFFADLALKTSRGAGRGAEVIPRYDAVIFDEAHAIEDVATEFFGVGASDYRIEDLLRDTERSLDDVEDPGEVKMLLDKLERVGTRFFGNVAGLLPRSREPQKLTAAQTSRLRGDADDLTDSLLALRGCLNKEEDVDVQGLARRAREISDDLEFLVAANEPGFVYWAEGRARATFIRAAPIDVAEELANRLYRNVDTVIFTSATLATQGQFDFAKRRLGLVDQETGEDCYSVESLMLDSPFDYRTQAALYAPSHLPEPSDPAFVRAAAEEIFALCEITEGRAFVLFTSLRNMNEVHRLLKDRLPYRVLLQGERPKQALINDFKERPSVLFAAHSFWEGVDIAGEALSLVIIDKLPFASPGDPVVSARVELLRSRGHEPFSEYQVPQAALALRQGFGRLVRSRRDRGVVAVLDRRLTTKGYGRAFIESLPSCPRTSERARIAGWWKRTARAG